MVPEAYWCHASKAPAGRRSVLSTGWQGTTEEIAIGRQDAVYGRRLLIGGTLDAVIIKLSAKRRGEDSALQVNAASQMTRFYFCRLGHVAGSRVGRCGRNGAP